MSAAIRLLIADDHRMVREGLKAFIAPIEDFIIVGEAADGREAVELEAKLAPDVVLLDLVMPAMSGIEAVRAIRAQRPTARIIMISSFVQEAQVIEAIKSGVCGYLLKDSTPEEIESAIRAVARGGSVFPPNIASMLVREISQPRPPAANPIPLTEREMDILKLIAQGLSNQEIANRLVLSVWTVRTYVTTILDKLGVENRTQATLYALREGLVKLED